MTVGRVRTVLGDLPAETLGVTNAHDHLLIRAAAGTIKQPELVIDSVEKACEEVALFQRGGGRTVVDMMPMGTGRDAAGLVEVSRRTGLHVIAAAGFHQSLYYAGDHWVHQYSEAQIAELFVQDVTLGMDRYDYVGPIVERLPAKAGVLKAATDLHAFPPLYEKLFAAVAAAHLATGAPISTHTTMGTMALEQVACLQRHGVAPDAVILGHMDRNMDFGYHKAVAETGAYLIYDGPCRIKYQPDAAIIELIRRMCEAGFSERILLGNDLAARSYRRSYGGGPGFGYLLDVFVPRLRAAGLDAVAVRRLTIENPARAFALRTPARPHSQPQPPAAASANSESEATGRA